MNVSTFETHKKVNLTIGTRFRRRVMVCVQVSVYVVTILYRARISGRFGWIGPDFGLLTSIPIFPSWLTCDCEELAHF